jgi:hypothetical protein
LRVAKPFGQENLQAVFDLYRELDQSHA